jgi:hypothetical protein
MQLKNLIKKTRLGFLWALALGAGSFFAPGAPCMAQVSLAPYNVIWNAQSSGPSGSMPIGNGDIGANVWVDSSGLLQLYISKTDAYSEIGRLLKIGKITIATTPAILNGASFTQTLDIQTGSIEIKATNAKKESIHITIFADANNPAITIIGKASTGVSLNIKNALWRNKKDTLLGGEKRSAYGMISAPFPLLRERDTILENTKTLIWVHQNKSSIWQSTLDIQNLTKFNEIGKDPLLYQNFGAVVSTKEQVSKPSQKDFEINITVLKKQTANILEWKKEAVSLHNKTTEQPSTQRFIAHQKWWNNFWNKHYLIVTPGDSSKQTQKETFAVTQGYQLQRYMNACAGRGGLPIKFNGSIFTVDVDESMGKRNLTGYDADFRDWGANYWFQNTRLPYYSMLYSGDFELIKPLFKMYTSALPLAKYRTQKYFNHKGAYFPETMTPWGTYANDNYGWNRKNLADGVSENMYIRYLWEGSLELSTLMLDYYAFTKDQQTFIKEHLPFIQEIIWFYNAHYKRNTANQIVIEPAQALESYFEGVVNPLPEIAGLTRVLNGLIANQLVIKDPSFLKIVKELYASLPALPTQTIKGQTALAPGYHLGPRTNVEKPELYAVFPFRLRGVGKEKIEEAIVAFNNKANNEFSGWQQDPIFAAYLGLTKEAKEMVVHNFTTKHGGSRFPAFWGPNYDWVPDQDHGTVNMRALQNMLVQSEVDQTNWLPAWPTNWNVDFKVHLQQQKVVTGKYSAQKGLSIIQTLKNPHF